MIYTVKTVRKEDREPVIQGKQFHSYVLTLAEHETEVQMLQAPGTPPLSVGETVEGIIEAGKEKQDGGRWPDRLKRAKKDGGFRPRDPTETARIVRQHSQEMAIRWVPLSGAKPGEASFSDLKTLIDWFDQDAYNVGSERPTEPPKPQRDAIPRIPLDRADQIRKTVTAHNVPIPTYKAKLTAVGVQSGLTEDLNVDQAESVETWLKGEGNASA